MPPRKPYVKLYAELFESESFQKLSTDAKLMFITCLIIAASISAGGRITPCDDIAYRTGLTVSDTERFTRELVNAYYLSEQLDGSLWVPRWEEYCADQSGERVKLHRTRVQSAETVTSLLHATVTPKTVTVEREKESNKEKEKVSTGSLRSPDKNSFVTLQKPDLWVQPLRDFVRDLLPRTLSSLSVEERFSLGRYHAWRWSNCTIDEKRNRRVGTKIAAGITNIAQDRRYNDLTVAHYISYADEVWKERGESPWHSPWDIIGRVEYA